MAHVAVSPTRRRKPAATRPSVRRVQHWLKVMHRFTGGAVRTFGDPHRLGADGEPLMRPAYEPGDLALVYLAGTYRCPALAEVVVAASFDSSQRRWGWRTDVRVIAEAPLE